MFVQSFLLPLRFVLTVRDIPQHNILIDAHGSPCLADFGLSSIAESICSVSGSSSTGGGTARWIAPELMRTGPTTTTEGSRGVRPTPQSDIYSLAMVVVEVASRLVCCLFKLLHPTPPASRFSLGRYRFRVPPMRTSCFASRMGSDHQNLWTGKNLGLSQRFGNSPRNVGIGTPRNDLTSPMSSTVSRRSSSRTPWSLPVALMNPLGEGHFLQPGDSSGGRVGIGPCLIKSASTSSIR